MNVKQVRDVQKIALGMLARREHSQLELRSKLLVRGFGEDVVTQVLEELVKLDLQSDKRFAEAYIRARMMHGFGPVRIQQELKGKGIHNELLSQSIHDIENEWFSLACDERRKKFGNIMPNDFRERAKQMHFLQYRGFTMEQINQVMRDDHVDEC